MDRIFTMFDSATTSYSLDGVLQVLKDGDTLDSIFNRCTEFADRVELAKVLALGVKDGSLVRLPNGTYARNQFDNLVINVPKKETTPKKKYRKSVKLPGRRYGNLTRGTLEGCAALALYVNKGKLLTIEDVKRITGRDAKFGITLRSLCKKKYAYIRYLKSEIAFGWSDQFFDYPFYQESGDDLSALAELP